MSGDLAGEPGGSELSDRHCAGLVKNGKNGGDGSRERTFAKYAMQLSAPG